MLALLATACSGDGPTKPHVATPAGGASRALVRGVEAIVSGDVQRVERELALADRSCTTGEITTGGGPQCPPGVPDGTRLPSLAVAACGGGFVAGDEVGAVLKQLFVGPSGLRLFGAYADEFGQVVGLFVPSTDDKVALLAFFNDAGIIGFGTMCGERPEAASMMPDGSRWITGGP